MKKPYGINKDMFGCKCINFMISMYVHLYICICGIAKYTHIYTYMLDQILSYEYVLKMALVHTYIRNGNLIVIDEVK